MKLRSIRSLLLAGLLGSASAAPTRLADQTPERIRRQEDGKILIDFGRVAFGNLRLQPPAGASGRVTVHFGEALTKGAIDRKPPGTVRYSKVEVELRGGQPMVVAPRYDSLKAKMLMDRVGPDGLVISEKQHITKEGIVDWPKTERDGYVFTRFNTVVNAFHLRALTMMAEMGRALGRDDEAARFAVREAKSRTVFNEKFFDPKLGIYRDGADTPHTSLHANLFPLAFGLVPPERRPAVAAWLVKRGMKCSVYPAQYLMDALFENGRGAETLVLMIAPGDRSWRHMVESGTTIAWEAWDQKYKPNQDWNHAWGAAPANLLPRHVLGVRALEAG